MTRPLHRLTILGLLVWLTGCATARYPLPMTASQLANYSQGGALAAYLSQPDASAEVCDRQASIPHIKTVDAETRNALNQGFRQGAIPPPVWNACMSALLRDADPSLSPLLMDDLAQSALDALQDKHLETDVNAQARVESVEQLYTERDTYQPPGPKALKNLADTLQRDIAKNRLGAFGLSHAKDLLTVIDVEAGQWQSKPVDSSLLKTLSTRGDEKTLRLIMLRSPDASLRKKARRDVVQLHIQASPYPEVQASASAVRKAMKRGGTNPVSLHDHPLVRGTLDAALTPARHVVVEQDVPNQTARLLGYVVNGSTTPTVLPAIPLKNALRVVLTGISKPVTVCAPGKDLDVSPCLALSDVRLESPYGILNGSGVIHVTDAVDMSTAAALALSGQDLVLPIAVAKQDIAALDWPVSFQTPTSLVFRGRDAGESGPSLDIRVDARNPKRLVYAISDEDQPPLWAVVELASAEDFHILSQGANGFSGANGSDGSAGANGVDGSDASCPSFSGSSGSNGTDGSDGGDGGNGGPGGNGGLITVTAVDGSQMPANAFALLNDVVQSRGGAGGSGGYGGQGGAGGHGGRGGSATLCSTTDDNGNMVASTMLNGGSNGSDGNSGTAGSNGFDGPAGHPGPVTFVGF